MVLKWRTLIPALTRKERRTVYVYLPDDAEWNGDARYPVLYMFDGHNVFFDADATYGKCWGMKEFLDINHVPLIVVGVDCNHHPDNGRLSEYSPYSFSDPRFGTVNGRGKLYMDWLTGTLKPMIDARYPTLPDREHTWIAGSSMGGLMSLYAIAAYNRFFSRAAALSPSIWVNGKKLRKLLRTADLSSDTVIYMDYGAREMREHDGMSEEFAATVFTLMQRQALVNARIVPNGDHCEACWEEQIPFFMETLFYQRD